MIKHQSNAIQLAKMHTMDLKKTNLDPRAVAELGDNLKIFSSYSWCNSFSSPPDATRKEMPEPAFRVHKMVLPPCRRCGWWRRWLVPKSLDKLGIHKQADLLQEHDQNCYPLFNLEDLSPFGNEDFFY